LVILKVWVADSQEDILVVNQERNQIPQSTMSFLVLKRVQHSIKSKKHSERRLSKSILIKVETFKNGRKSLLHMMFCPTKIREKCTTTEVKKVFNKEELAVVATVISSRRCLEVVVADREDHKRERVFNMQLRLLLKKYIKEKQVKLLLIEIESVPYVLVKVERMELMPLAALVKEEEW